MPWRRSPREFRRSSAAAGYSDRRRSLRRSPRRPAPADRSNRCEPGRTRFGERCTAACRPGHSPMHSIVSWQSTSTASICAPGNSGSLPRTASGNRPRRFAQSSLANRQKASSRKVVRRTEAHARCPTRLHRETPHCVGNVPAHHPKVPSAFRHEAQNAPLMTAGSFTAAHEGSASPAPGGISFVPPSMAFRRPRYSAVPRSGMYSRVLSAPSISSSRIFLSTPPA